MRELSQSITDTANLYNAFYNNADCYQQNFKEELGRYEFDLVVYDEMENFRDYYDE